jgi:hypothetical protein
MSLSPFFLFRAFSASSAGRIRFPGPLAQAFLVRAFGAGGKHCYLTAKGYCAMSLKASWRS